MNKYKYPSPGSSLWQLQQLLPLFSVVLLLATAGCRQDRLPGERPLKLRFGSISQAGSAAIREIEVFVFDDQLRLIGRATTTVDGTLSLDYPHTSTLHCIAWGNSKNNSLEISTLQPGDPLEKGNLALTPLSPAQDGTTYSNLPPDLFRGTIKLDNNATTAAQPSNRMVMLRTTASIHITIDGLSETIGTAAGLYTVEISKAASHVDFEGNYGGTATHRLTGSFNAQKEYVIPPFRLFPPAVGKGITIAIFHDGILLKRITQTSDRQPIRPEAGKDLKLLIIFDPGGDVEVKAPGWNTSDVEVVYPK